MSDLEQRYRQLLRAYPAEHRRHREDEVVGALLDASAPGQSWPAPREATAIIVNGWRVRASSATEWRHGFAIASAAAVAIAAVIAAALLGVAVLPPLDAGRAPASHVYGPVAAWAFGLVAVAGACVARRSRVPLALGAVSLAVALAGGSDLLGARRSVAVPFACFVLIAAAGAGGTTAWRRARFGALVIGVAGGIWLVVRTVRVLGPDHHWLMGGKWPWLDRWMYSPHMTHLPDSWWWTLVVVSLVAGLVRPRYAVAGALLCTPLLPLTSWTFDDKWIFEQGMRLVAVLVALVAVALVRGWLAYRPGPSRSSGEPG